MARDYAKPRKPTSSRGSGAARGSSRGSGSGGMSGSTGLAVGLSVGLAVAVAVGAYFSVEKPSNRVKLGQDAPSTPTSPPLSRKPSAEGSAATGGKLDGQASRPDPDAGKPIKLPPKQPSRFAFYEMLPSYEVVIPRDSARAAKPGQPPSPPSAPDVKQALAEPGQYLIQVGAYRSRDEADRHRASLALLGIESRIEQVTIDQKDTWYRVRIGPEPSLAKAQEILDRLDDHDIKGMLIKVKG